MKKVLLILIMTVVSVLAQNVTVVEDIAVTAPGEGKYYYPAVTPDGTGILFSSENRKGLWYKNLASGETILITDALGAGYEPGFNPGNNEIIYREDNFDSGKRLSSLVSYNLMARKSTVLDQGIRDLKIGRSVDKISYNYLRGTELHSINKSNALQKNNSSDVLVFIENAKIKHNLYSRACAKVLMSQILKGKY